MDTPTQKQTRVLIVDDSSLVRKLLTHLLGAHDHIEIVGTACDAKEARTRIKELDPDVVTLDIEMPGMNGLEFLEKVMTLRPTPVVMISTLTRAGAQASLRALQLGAFDVFPKPVENLAAELERYRDKLHQVVLSAAQANVAVLARRAQRTLNNTTIPDHPPAPAMLPQNITNRIIAIGASTGGTEAIRHVLQGLPPNSPGVVIAQHLPDSFTAPFAARLNDNCSLTVKLAEDREPIRPGHVYVAPGTAHLVITAVGSTWQCELDPSGPVNRHRPSVDVLFKSVANQAGAKAVACLLTGMGKDGAEGLSDLKAAGAPTMVQDEASSVVWGMPGSAVKLGAADQILPLGEIATAVVEKLSPAPAARRA